MRPAAGFAEEATLDELSRDRPGIPLRLKRFTRFEMGGEMLLRLAGGIVGFALLVALWWLAASRLGPTRLPTPAAVGRILIPVLHSSDALRAQNVDNGIAGGLAYTTEKAVSGVALGSAIGLILGVLMGVSRIANEFLSKIVEILRTIPPLAAVPFFLIWFGTGSNGQLLLIAFYSAMMVVISARAAVHHIDPVFEAYASTFGASRLARIRTVVLPAMVPEVVGGIRVALAFSWGIEVVAELLGAQNGIGHDFVLLTTVLQVDEIMASIIWISLIAAIVDLIYVAGTGRMTRWVAREG